MLKYRAAFFILIAASLLAACSSTRDRAGDGVEFGRGETFDAVGDAIGLPRERPGAVMVDPGNATVRTPYGGAGARRVCSTVARDIARLTAVLGPDAEDASLHEAVDDEGWTSRSGRAAAGAGRDLYRSLIVGLNPARPVVRFVGRANEIEAAARMQREMALKRRAYLRGMYDGFGCQDRYLLQAFEIYGLRP